MFTCLCKKYVTGKSNGEILVTFFPCFLCKDICNHFIAVEIAYVKAFNLDTLTTLLYCNFFFNILLMSVSITFKFCTNFVFHVLLTMYKSKLGMGTNTENGILNIEYSVQLFEYIPIFVLGENWNIASISSGDCFSVCAPHISGYWYSTRSI